MTNPRTYNAKNLLSFLPQMKRGDFIVGDDSDAISGVYVLQRKVQGEQGYTFARIFNHSFLNLYTVFQNGEVKQLETFTEKEQPMTYADTQRLFEQGGRT